MRCLPSLCQCIRDNNLEDIAAKRVCKTIGNKAPHLGSMEGIAKRWRKEHPSDEAMLKGLPLLRDEEGESNFDPADTALIRL